MLIYNDNTPESVQSNVKKRNLTYCIEFTIQIMNDSLNLNQNPALYRLSNRHAVIYICYLYLSFAYWSGLQIKL